MASTENTRKLAKKLQNVTTNVTTPASDQVILSFPIDEVHPRAVPGEQWGILKEHRHNKLHAEGMISSAYAESNDPERKVPVFVKPEGIGIVLSGDTGRNQSKGFVQNQSHGYPTGKKIQLPANWESMIKKKLRQEPRTKSQLTRPRKWLTR